MSNPSNYNDKASDDVEHEIGDDKVTGGGSETLAKGISALITTVINNFDSRAVSTCHSQHQLLSSLDRLTQELDQLLEDAPLPFIMQHAAKLSNVRKRVSSLNSVLRSIQRRLDNVDLMLSAGVPSGT